MKQSSDFRLDYSMNDDEMEVASILLQLQQSCPPRLPFTLPAWGTKRKRSAEDISFMRRVCFPSPALQSSINDIASVSGPIVLGLDKVSGKVEAASTSPTTPFSFSPSESSEKPKRLKNKLSVKKRKEELLEIEKECTITNELLRKEVEETRVRLMGLEAQNQRLQARKQELSEKEKQEKGGENKKEKVAASEIPDLNVSVSPPGWMDLVQPFDDDKSYTKAMAAQARQRRRLICKDKNFSAISKSRICCRR